MMWPLVQVRCSPITCGALLHPASMGQRLSCRPSRSWVRFNFVQRPFPSLASVVVFVFQETRQKEINILLDPGVGSVFA